jgi:hypothetical protein
MRWRAWYTGRRVFFGEGLEDWRALPDDGVLTVMLYHEDGTRRVQQGNDFYFAAPSDAGEVFGHSDDLDIEGRYPGASVKRGMWTTDAEMGRVGREAIES